MLKLRFYFLNKAKGGFLKEKLKKNRHFFSN